MGGGWLGAMRVHRDYDGAVERCDGLLAGLHGRVAKLGFLLCSALIQLCTKQVLVHIWLVQHARALRQGGLKFPLVRAGRPAFRPTFTECEEVVRGVLDGMVLAVGGLPRVGASLRCPAGTVQVC